MNKVVDFAGLWFMGLMLGISTSGILSNPSQKFSEQLARVQFFTNYPYSLPCFLNTTFSLILLVAIYILYPTPNLIDPIKASG